MNIYLGKILILIAIVIIWLDEKPDTANILFILSVDILVINEHLSATRKQLEDI